jgi:hypothetical protein
MFVLSHANAPPLGSADRLMKRYALAAFCVAVLWAYGYELDRAFNLYFLIGPILLLPAFGLGIWALAGLISGVYHKHWVRAVSALLGPILSCLLVYGLLSMGVTPDRIRFEFLNADFDRQIEAGRAARATPLLMRFHWGETGGAGATNWIHLLYYDESDEIQLPTAQRSNVWWQRRLAMQQHEAQSPSSLKSFPMIEKDYFGNVLQDWKSVKRLRGHYFVVSQIY